MQSFVGNAESLFYGKVGEVKMKTMIVNIDEPGERAWDGSPKTFETKELVRCKECKYLIDHYGFMDDGYCESMREKHCLKFKPNADWFCADGKRRTDDD